MESTEQSLTRSYLGTTKDENSRLSFVRFNTLKRTVLVIGIAFGTASNILNRRQTDNKRYSVNNTLISEQSDNESSSHFNNNNMPHPTTSLAIQPVHWIKDKVWFDAQASRGCCPYPSVLYKNRYSKIGFRCCFDRLETIQPLRPMGGALFTPPDDDIYKTNATITALLVNASVLLQGDSIAEQHFLALLCLAWSQNLTVDLTLERSLAGQDKLGFSGTTWRAVIQDNNQTRFNDTDNINRMTIQYNRYNTPGMDPAINYSDHDHDFVLLGGWHHGRLEQLESFVAQVTAQRPNRPTILVEALPNHFPSSGWLKQNKNSSCVPTNYSADPNINHRLAAMVTNATLPNTTTMSRPNLHLLKVQRLYTHRGDAHVEWSMNDQKPGKARDCLHYCYSPGVLDAMAMETLGLLVSAAAT
jgi:hypothetical protein